MASIPFEPQKLSKLLDYQEGSVVSREVFRSDNGTVTLFAFDQNQGLSTHETIYDAFVIIIDGQMNITIDDTLHQVPAGSFLYLPARHPHALTAVEKTKMLLFMIRSVLD